MEVNGKAGMRPLGLTVCWLLEFQISGTIKNLQFPCISELRVI